jgi:replication factor C large subunit
MTPWIHKYLPKTTKDVIGQQKAIEELRDFIVHYKSKKSRSCILFGATGNGKTSSVYAISKELGLELVDMNASDFRDKESIEKKIGTAIKQQSLFFKGKIILVDEIDGMSGNNDRGAMQAIGSLIEESTFPVVCTVNDPYDKKFSDLRKKSVLIEYQTLDYRSITNNLKHILEEEKCEYDEEALKALARRQGGDMRAAINDLQSLTNTGKKKLTQESVKELEENERNRTESIMNALIKVLKTTDPNVARGAFDNVDEDIDGVALWLEENIPKEYEGEDLKNAMMWMSKADVYKGRITRWQHWRFLSYINDIYTAGIALSKKEKYQKFVKYGPSGKILKMWIAKNKYMKRKAIAEKLSSKMHVSSRRAVQDIIPYISIMCKKDKNLAERFQKEYNIENEEMEWIIK